MNEEELELHPALVPSSGPWDLPVALVAVVVVVLASVVMERTGTSLGRHFAVPPIVVGGVVLAAVTSLPNAVAAVYLARRGRGTAMLSTALNSNALNIAFRFLLPATLVGLGARSSRESFVAVWNLGLTAVVLALAYRDRGLRRHTGTIVLVAYGLFVAALVAVAHGHLTALVLAGPAVFVVAWAVIAMVASRGQPAGDAPGADPASVDPSSSPSVRDSGPR